MILNGIMVRKINRFNKILFIIKDIRARKEIVFKEEI